VNSLLALATQDTTLRHAASTGGGEWCGPCPGCGGCDRFRMWPEKGRYWCRGCNKKGDAILRDFRGLSFREAARRVGKNLGPYQPKPAADLLWLPTRCPELNPLEALWRSGKQTICANRQYPTIDEVVERFLVYLYWLSRQEAHRKAGLLSKHCWLKLHV
jgi:hypothetical protein